MIQYQKLPVAFWKMPLWVIFVENIWIIMLYFSWDLWFCRCSPIWLLIVLFWDLTLCSLVNGYQPRSITFKKEFILILLQRLQIVDVVDHASSHPKDSSFTLFNLQTWLSCQLYPSTHTWIKHSKQLFSLKGP